MVNLYFVHCDYASSQSLFSLPGKLKISISITVNLLKLRKLQGSQYIRNGSVVKFQFCSPNIAAEEIPVLFQQNIFQLIFWKLQVTHSSQLPLKGVGGHVGKAQVF